MRCCIRLATSTTSLRRHGIRETLPSWSRLQSKPTAVSRWTALVTIAIAKEKTYDQGNSFPCSERISHAFGFRGDHSHLDRRGCSQGPRHLLHRRGRRRSDPDRNTPG